MSGAGSRTVGLLGRPLRFRFGLPHVRRGDRHRDRGEWIEAVVAYRQGLGWLPWRQDLLIQIGNCLKEFGDHGGAIRAYGSVSSIAHRPEALRQLGDAQARGGGGTLPFGDHDPTDDAELPPLSARLLPNRIAVDRAEPRRWLGPLGVAGGRAMRNRGNFMPSIILDQVGSMVVERDGVREPLLAGVVAIRARIFSLQPIDTIDLLLGDGADERIVATARAHAVERGLFRLRLYVVNAWIDTAELLPGRNRLTVRARGEVAPTRITVTVMPAGELARDLAASDGFVPSPDTVVRDVDAFVVAMPARARPAARSLLNATPRSILVMRVDQLGDVSASLPAIARLRALYPGARLTALVPPALAGIVTASGLVDEVLTLALDYDAAAEHRFLSREAEARARAELARRSFDLAIDLCPGHETRPLLLLTGATFLVGFGADRFTFLDYGVTVRSRDKVNQLEAISHATTVLTLVEGLALATGRGTPAVPRTAPLAPVLAPHGLVPGRYAVLHTGARHAINRWPAARFFTLAERLLGATDLAVTLFADAYDGPVPAALADHPRIRLFGTIDGDAFDAILSGAAVMVGNDSGPKHLAAMRGVPTVSAHIDRLNWSEWGQDARGTIVSKAIPCAGCGLNDIDLCGREAVCVRGITVEEMLAAVLAELGAAGAPS